MTTYIYTGETGIPGLPHRISEEEAKAAGLFELLQAAIANGSYVSETPAPTYTVSTETPDDGAPSGGAKKKS